VIMGPKGNMINVFFQRFLVYNKLKWHLNIKEGFL